MTTHDTEKIPLPIGLTPAPTADEPSTKPLRLPWLARIDLSAVREWSALRLAGLVFLASLLLFVALTPTIQDRWQLTGDEPHYLLATYSLLVDHDIELGNNYISKDFRRNYAGTELGMHATQPRPDGGQYPIHGVGLSVLLVPFYALGDRLGVLYFLNLIGALMAANVFLLGYDTTGSKRAALAVAAITALSSPTFWYVFQIYPDPIGGLIALWVWRRARRASEQPLWAWLLLGLALAGLPWLVGRFVILLFALVVFALAMIRLAGVQVRARAAALLAPVALSFAGYCAFNWYFYGNWSPLASFSAMGADMGRWSSPVQLLSVIPSGLGDLFLDQLNGLLTYAPIYVVALLGLLLMLRERRREGLWLCWVIAPTVLSSATAGAITAWGVSPRYLVAVLPLLAGPLAYALRRVTSHTFRGIAVALALLSVLSTVFLYQGTLLAYNTKGFTGKLVGEYSKHTGIDFTRVLPNYWGAPQEGPWSFRIKPEGYVAVAGGDYTNRAATHDTGQVADDEYAGGHLVVAAAPPADQPGYLLRSNSAISPADDYLITFYIKSPGTDNPDAVVAVMDVVNAWGTVMDERPVTAGQLARTFSYQPITLEFRADTADAFRFGVRYTGSAELRASEIYVEHPRGVLEYWGLAIFWTLVIALFVGYFFWNALERESEMGTNPLAVESAAAERPDRRLYALAAGLLALAALGVVGRSVAALDDPKVYQAESMRRHTGRVVADPRAQGGRAVEAAPGDDAAGHIAYGPYAIYTPGDYVACYRLESAPTTDDVVAMLDVSDLELPELAYRDLRRADFAAGGYQTFCLPFHNDAQQSLEFRVAYTGKTTVWLDSITVSPVAPRRQ